MAIGWQWDFDKVGAVTNSWLPNDLGAGVFAVDAFLAVESLDYLALLDHDALTQTVPRTYGYGPEVADTAHVRWSAVTAVSALDLCAQTLAIRHTGRPAADYAAALASFVPAHHTNPTRVKTAQDLYDRLPAPATAWVDAAWSDTDYQTVRNARNPLTHHHLTKTVFAGGPTNRTAFPIGPGGALVSSDDLLRIARDMAVRHVGRFLDGLSAQDF